VLCLDLRLHRSQRLHVAVMDQVVVLGQQRAEIA